MKLQLRSLIDKSVTTMQNYFCGFLSLNKLQRLVSPLRHIRPMITKSKTIMTRQEQLEKKRRQEIEQGNTRLAKAMQ